MFKKIKKKIRIWRFFKSANYTNLIMRLYVELRIFLSKPLILETKSLGITIKFGITSTKEYIYRFKNSYVCEQITVDWIADTILPSDLVWDVGANVGAYSLLIGKKQLLSNENGRVFAFEPEAGNFYSLNRNIEINDLGKQIIPVPIAISSKRKFTTFYLSSSEVGSATHSIDNSESDGKYFKPVHTQGIFAFSLDSLIEDENFECPNHIKVDIDGLELDVVYGMRNLIKNLDLRSVLIEIGSISHANVIKDIFSKENFVCAKSSPISADGNAINYIFIRKA